MLIKDWKNETLILNVRVLWRLGCSVKVSVMAGYWIVNKTGAVLTCFVWCPWKYDFPAIFFSLILVFKGEMLCILQSSDDFNDIQIAGAPTVYAWNIFSYAWNAFL